MDSQQQMQMMNQMMQQMSNNSQMNSNPMMNSMMNSMNQMMNNQNNMMNNQGNMMNNQMGNNNILLMNQLYQLMNQYNQLMQCMQMHQFSNNNFNPLMNQITNTYNQIQNNIAGNQNYNQNFQLDNKVNVQFKTTYSTITNLVLDPNTTVEEMLSIYLKRVGHPELINKIEGTIQFLYSANSLNFGDKRPVKNVFLNGLGGHVIVIDIKKVIGA